MSEEESTSSSSDATSPEAGKEHDGESVAPDRTLREGFCPSCSYDLRGLATIGKCPECGTAYTPILLLPPRTIPSAMELLVRFGWPTGVLAASLVVIPLDGSAYAVVTWALVAMIILAAMFTNSLIQVHLVFVKHIAQPHRGRFGFAEKAALLGKPLLAAFWATVLIPAFVLGGCLLLVCSGM